MLSMSELTHAVITHLIIRCPMKSGPFVDGQARSAKQLPGTLHIPSMATIMSKAVPGVFVKLGCKGDVFWVQVNGNDPGKQILTGVVVSRPQGTAKHGISMRDPVQFGYRHVLDILPL